MAVFAFCLLVGPALAAGLKVAAVQHTSLPDDVSQPSWTNLGPYLSLIRQAATQDVDVMVFPEFGLFDPQFSSTCSQPSSPMGMCLPLNDAPVGSNPCLDTTYPWHFAIRNLSCAARDGNLTAMIDLCETANNNTAFNTALILGPQGQIQAVYRKMHPWFGECFAAADNNPTTISVGGKTLGIFVCKDILYPTPGPWLAHAGISTFLYTVALQAVGAEAVKVWSKTYNATVVASDLSVTQGGVFIRGQRMTAVPSKVTDQLVVYELD